MKNGTEQEVSALDNRPPKELVQDATTLLDVAATDPKCRVEVRNSGWCSPGHMKVCGVFVAHARDSYFQSNWEEFHQELQGASNAERRRLLVVGNIVSGVVRWRERSATSVTEEDVTRSLAICLTTAAREYVANFGY